MIRLIHAADLHLDSPFSIHSPREAERRRNDLRSDLTSLMLYIRSKKVQLCLLSGDLFDSESVTPDTLALLEKELAACPDCYFFLAAGNHDPLRAGSAYCKLCLPNLHVFSPQKECVSLDELGVDVYGFSFDGTNGNTNPLTGYPPLRTDRLNLLCCHGELDGSPSGNNGSFTRSDLARSGFDYVALGHIHKGTGVQCENGVCWAYPGCIEGRGFDETGYKGVLYGTVEKGKIDLQFLQMSKRRYETVSCDVTGCDRAQALERLRETVRPFGADTALRVCLTGEVKNGILLLPEEVGSGPKTPYLLEIRDQTVLEPDFTELESSNTLAGMFCRLIREKQENGEADEQTLRDALKYGLLALQDRNISDLDLRGFEGGR